MIDFTTLQGLTIPEGVVTQITDDSGRVIWAVSGGKAIFEVEKVTSDTYANETQYTAEQFILLTIYPKTNGTVNITYGGLTKTITDTSGAAAPNAQQVFFGTFNGMADSVETPASGELTVEGDYYAVGQSTWKTTDKSLHMVAPVSCVTSIKNFGNITTIPYGAFYNCDKITSLNFSNSVTDISSSAFVNCGGLASVYIGKSVARIAENVFSYCIALTNIVVDSQNKFFSGEGGTLFNKDKTLLHSFPTASGSCSIPDGVTSIGGYAFAGCGELTSITIPDGVTSIGGYAFESCGELTSITIPDGVTSIGDYAFASCGELTSVTFENTSGWYVTETQDGDISTGTAVDLSNPANNATLLTDTYLMYYWYRS